MKEIHTLLILCSEHSQDSGVLVSPLLSLQDRFFKKGIRVFLAFPSIVRNYEWFTKLCLEGRKIDTFQQTDKDAFLSSVSSLLEKISPDALYAFGMRARDVEAVVRPYKNLTAYLEYTENDYRYIESKHFLPHVFHKIHQFQVCRNRIIYLYRTEWLGRELPNNSVFLPQILRPEFERSDENNLPADTVRLGISFDEDRKCDVTSSIFACKILNEKNGVKYELFIFSPKDVASFTEPFVHVLSEAELGCTNVDVWLDTSPEYIDVLNALEFVASKKPVIVSYTNGTDELLRYSNVLPCDTNNTEVFAGTILKASALLQSPNADAAAYVKRKYSCEHFENILFGLLVKDSI